MKILCVDDSMIVRNAVTHEARRTGHDCDEAKDATEGMEKLRKNRYSLVILDYNMPGMSGLDMLRALQQENLDTGPVVMLTTETSSTMKKAGQELGVKAWIVKPLKQGTMELILEKLARP